MLIRNIIDDASRTSHEESSQDKDNHQGPWRQSPCCHEEGPEGREHEQQRPILLGKTDEVTNCGKLLNALDVHGSQSALKAAGEKTSKTEALILSWIVSR